MVDVCSIRVEVYSWVYMECIEIRIVSKVIVKIVWEPQWPND